MSKVVRAIGVLVLTVLFISVPVIFGVSIAANWCDYISLLLGMATVGETTLVYIWLYYAAEDE